MKVGFIQFEPYFGQVDRNLKKAEELILKSEAEVLVKSLGGQAKSSVTKGLSYLVTNDPESGSDKNRKARAFGIPVIGEEEFLSLVGRKA